MAAAVDDTHIGCIHQRSDGDDPINNSNHTTVPLERSGVIGRRSVAWHRRGPCTAQPDQWLCLTFVHVLLNALAPVVQVVALTLAYLAGGVVLVEFVFGYPGVGQGLLEAIVARDVPVIQLIVLILAAVYVLLNLLADLIAMLLNPRMSARQWQST